MKKSWRGRKPSSATAPPTANIRWNAVAQRELFRARAALRDANPDAAERWWADVIIMTNTLATLPSLGHRLRRDADGEIRQTTVGSYRFIFRVEGKEIEMLRVRHVRRDYNPQTIRDSSMWQRVAFVPA